jgi:hypothetical protein
MKNDFTVALCLDKLEGPHHDSSQVVTTVFGIAHWCGQMGIPQPVVSEHPEYYAINVLFTESRHAALLKARFADFVLDVDFLDMARQCLLAGEPLILEESILETLNAMLGGRND